MNQPGSLCRALAFALGLLFVSSPGNGARQAPAEAPPGLDPDLLKGLRLRNIGPANMSGRIVDIAVVESDPYVFYVASATGGLWKTTDNGVTFKPVWEKESVHSIGCLAIFQPNPEILWLGSGERANRQSSSWGDGVYKSSDGGESWTNLGLGDSHHIGRIATHPTDPEVVYVAAMGRLWGPNRERGLYKTDDGGKTWKQILFLDEDTGVVDVAVDPREPQIVYAAAYQRRRQAFGFHGSGPGSALYKSTDGGASWRKLSRDLPEGDKGRMGISIYRRDPRIVYVCIEQGLRYNASTEYGEYRAGVYRSEDRGESWKQMSTWNPRPMYASQILVDPNDDQRVYMMNNYSYSEDGGKTFKDVEQSLHGDDRILWVNPRDSRHLIKGDDGGVGISYDRGLKWLYLTALPVSQFYRVAVDMRRPFWVYGGLQDNGSWAGPSATYHSWGILNEDWVRTGGGDGFFSVPDPSDDRTVYVNSQYLGLTRFDLVSREARSIRPVGKEGEAPKLGNWGPPPPRVGKYTAPANWDAPFIVSPHDPKTVYAGMRVLWKSSDRGDSWTSLGDLTNRIDRSELTIMGQRPTASVGSLDDGVPYFSTITALAESPLSPGLVYVGTDDGNLQVSRDGGASWSNLASRIPGLPRMSWVADVVPSRFRAGRVYLAFDNHRHNDFNNYLYLSDDYGQSWTSIAEGLPPRRVIRSVGEDTRNENLLFVGTEFGLFLSIDAGRHWTELRNNLPTMAFNDFVIHPRDNDLVLATHNRGIWILDNLASLQELTPQVLGAEAHLFPVEPAEMIRYSNPKAHAGDMIFKGENPPAGAIIDYYLREKTESDLVLSIHDAQGAEILQLEPSKERGINRVVWNLRYPALAPPAFRYMGSERTPAAPPGPFVIPGRYTARLKVRGKTYEQSFEVREDPRIEVSAEERREWTESLLLVYEMYKKVTGLMEKAKEAAEAPRAPAEAKELHQTFVELQHRLGTLYGALNGYTGRPTADQRAQQDYFSALVKELESRASAAPVIR
jgi:photosystem II stability/assembly factor-like uncharacterized protein